MPAGAAPWGPCTSVVADFPYTQQVLDPSNGYEAAAARYMASRSRIGAAEVRAWAESLPRGASVPDLGCGHGVPVTEALLAAGFPCTRRRLPEPGVCLPRAVPRRARGV